LRETDAGGRIILKLILEIKEPKNTSAIFIPLSAMEILQRNNSALSLTSALDGGWVVNAMSPALLLPRE